MSSSQLYMYFDSETGGLNENKADLLTWYGCIVDEEYKILEELDLKLKPNDGRIPIAEAGALKVNKIIIADHMANPDTISYAEGQKKLVGMIKSHLKKNGRFSNISPAGYNVPFDIRWTQKHLLDQETWESLLHYKINDVMQNVDFLKKCGWVPKTLGSLTTVVDYFNVPARGAHNAKEDTLMTIDVEKKILELMKSKKDGGNTDLGQNLISLLEAE